MYSMDPRTSYMTDFLVASAPYKIPSSMGHPQLSNLIRPGGLVIFSTTNTYVTLLTNCRSFPYPLPAHPSPGRGLDVASGGRVSPRPAVGSWSYGSPPDRHYQTYGSILINSAAFWQRRAALSPILKIFCLFVKEDKKLIKQKFHVNHDLWIRRYGPSKFSALKSASEF